MVKVVERSAERLVLESKPRGAFATVLVIGLAATVGSLDLLLRVGRGWTADVLLGIVLGPAFAIGAALLYRETTTVFDRPAGAVTWRQRGLVVDRSDRARFDEVRDVVVGRPDAEESGGATQVGLVLVDRHWPLSFGFSALGRDRDVVAAIRSFVWGGDPGA